MNYSRYLQYLIKVGVVLAGWLLSAYQHWTRIRTNNAIEHLNREIERRTKAIGAFPDGQSALMLVCARLRHVAATNWGARHYMNMDHLFKSEEDLLSDIIAG